MKHLPAAETDRRARMPAAGVRPRLNAVRRILLVPIAALLLALALAGTAQANAGDRVIKLCQERKSVAGFSEKAYDEAIQEMSADDAEYSDCLELIADQEQEEAGKHRGDTTGRDDGGVGSGRAGGGSSGGTGEAAGVGQPVVPNAEEQKQIAQVQSQAPKHVVLGSGDEAVSPGVVHASVDSAVNSLPVPLLAAIAALLALIALLAGRAIRDRMRAADGEG